MYVWQYIYVIRNGYMLTLIRPQQRFTRCRRVILKTFYSMYTNTVYTVNLCEIYIVTW